MARKKGKTKMNKGSRKGDTALPPRSAQGRTEEQLGLRVGTQGIPGQLSGGFVGGGHG